MKVLELLNRAIELQNQQVRVEGKLIQKVQDESFYLASDTLDTKLALADTRQRIPRPNTNKFDEKQIVEMLNVCADKIIQQNPSLHNTILIAALNSGERPDIWRLFIDNGGKELLEEYSPFKLQLPYLNAISQLHSYFYFHDDSLKEEFFTHAFDAEVEGRLVLEGDYPILLDIEEISLASETFRRYFSNKQPNLTEIKMSQDYPITVGEILEKKQQYHQKTIRLSGILVGHTSYETTFYVVPNTSYGWLSKENRQLLSLSVESHEMANYLKMYIGPYRQKYYNYLYLANFVGELEVDSPSQHATLRNLKEFAILTDKGVFHWLIKRM